jgi:hypothetical protein
MKKLDEEQLEVILGAFKAVHSEHTFKQILTEKGLIKEELEVGKWYKTTSSNTKYLMCLTEITKDEFYEGSIGHKHYGFNGDKWRTDSWTNTVWSKNLVPATRGDLEEAFLRESHTRGFRKGDNVGNFNGINSELIHSHSYNFNLETNLFFRGGTCIFRNGEWATRIEEPRMEKIIEVLEKAIEELKTIK